MTITKRGFICLAAGLLAASLFAGPPHHRPFPHGTPPGAYVVRLEEDLWRMRWPRLAREEESAAACGGAASAPWQAGSDGRPDARA